MKDETLEEKNMPWFIAVKGEEILGVGTSEDNAAQDAYLNHGAENVRIVPASFSLVMRYENHGNHKLHWQIVNGIAHISL